MILTFGRNQRYVSPAYQAGLQHVDRNSLVPGDLASIAWHVHRPAVAPRRLPMAGVGLEAGTRSLVWVNYDRRAPDGARLERLFQAPSGVPAVRLELDNVVLPPSTPAGAFQLQVTDAVGGTVVSSASFTPTTTPQNVVGPEVTLTAGIPYRARVVVRSGATQSSFLCGRIRVRPVGVTGAARPLYNDFIRANVHPATIHATTEPTYESLRAWRNPRHCEMSEFAHYILRTDAAEFDVEYIDTVKRLMGAERANPSVWVDGEPIDPAVVVAWNTATFGRVKVPNARSGTARTISVFSGPQMTSFLAHTANLDIIRGENRGVFPVGVYLPASASVEVVLPYNRPVVVIADSKGAGAHSSIPGLNSWRFQMARKGVPFLAHAAGGETLAHFVGNPPSLASTRPLALKLLEHDPAEVIIQVTRNDYSNQRMTPADAVAAVGYLADAIHEYSPSTRVWIMTYTRENTENAVGGVAWDAQRDALAALASSRQPWCGVIWGGDFWTLEDAPLHNVSDTIHPSDWGQEKMTAGSVGDDFPFRPEDLGAAVFAHYKAGGDLLGGPAAGTPTAFGGAPVLAISGTSTVPGHLRVEMTLGGTRGGTPTPRFAWSFFGGGVWSESDVAMPANGVYALGTTGLVLTFPSGSYNNLMGWEHKLGVGQLQDMSGNARHVPAFSSANLATLEPDSLGHKSALLFNGVSQQYRLSNVTLTPPYAIFAVAKKNSTAAGAIVGRNGSTTSGALLHVNTASTFAFGDGVVTRSASCDPLAAHLYGAIVDAANSQLFLDGTATTVSLNNTTCTAFTIGGDSVNSFPWDGVILDVLFLQGRPSDTAVRAILRRARQEYGTP